ncbi:MAG: nitrite/sulfite reductase [Alphaproteobacteria bacterium]
MYRYDEFDATFVTERVDQFRGQVERRVKGELSEEQFRPLRLMNGLYLQLHAYMLRVAVPYGTLNSSQMRKLAFIADKYDRGYGHFTTRQNIQYNWPKLPDVPDILDHLADVEMHAIQTSGNCIRNVTADQWSGVAANEVEDPRPYAELMRQWSSLHPEFSFLPRKFKIAVTGDESDRAAIVYHDIGLRLKKNAKGEIGFEVFVGGGMGRTPMIAPRVREWLPKSELLSYLEAVMRVYNLNGRRDNKYKARIKILVHELGAEEFIAQVEKEFALIDAPQALPPERELERIAAYFAPPAYEGLAEKDATHTQHLFDNKDFSEWAERNVAPHKRPGYAIVNISLKPVGGVPGDASADQMRAVADLAENLSHDEIRVTHEQNLVLPNVRKRDLFTVWRELKVHKLADANIGLATDIIACPGLDYCGLATARSIPIAQDITSRFADISRQREIGDLKIKISGCINACGHHHAGHIGILGLEKRGQEYYQITLGGSGDEKAAVGQIIGPGFSSETITDAVVTIIDTYMDLRQDNETFLEAYRRVGSEPFKEAVYATH